MGFRGRFQQNARVKSNHVSMDGGQWPPGHDSRNNAECWTVNSFSPIETDWIFESRKTTATQIIGNTRRFTRNNYHIGRIG